MAKKLEATVEQQAETAVEVAEEQQASTEQQDEAQIDQQAETAVEVVEEQQASTEQQDEKSGDDSSTGFVEVDTTEIVVSKRFRDKFDHKTWYEVGSELTFDKERADDLISRGLAKAKE